MKKWEKAEISELNIKSTMKGEYSPTEFDDDVYDQNGKKIGARNGASTDPSGPKETIHDWPQG